MGIAKKLLTCSLITFIASPVMAYAAVSAGEENQRVVVKLNADESDEKEYRTIKLKTKTMKVLGKAKDIEAGGPWLGIQFGPVPKPLALHLGIEAGVGQMILNVIEDSPADLAGLQQHDVIVKIDGNNASSDMGEFLDVVRSFTPNETHSFSLVRESDSRDVNITVGTRPESVGDAKYKYEILADEMLNGKMFRRSLLLEKDDDGKWNFRRFHDLDEDMPDIWQHMPQIDADDITYSWQGGVPGLYKQMRIYVDKDQKVEVERKGDEITVTKTVEENGDKTTTTNTYSSEEEFEQSDPEIYRTYKDSFKVDFSLGHGPKGLRSGIFLHEDGDHNFQFDVDVDVDMDEILEHAKKAFRSHSVKLKDLHTHGHDFSVFVPSKAKTTF